MDIESAVVVIDGQQWEKDLPELGDLEVLVAPWENANYERELGKLIRALPPGLRADGAVEPRSFYICMGKATARTILFGWKNFRLAGAEKPFAKDYAEQLLIDPRYKPFRDGVVAAAKRVQLGIKQQDDDLLGNFSASSPGSATGEAIPNA